MVDCVYVCTSVVPGCRVKEEFLSEILFIMAKSICKCVFVKARPNVNWFVGFMYVTVIVLSKLLTFSGILYNPFHSVILSDSYMLPHCEIMSCKVGS